MPGKSSYSVYVVVDQNGNDLFTTKSKKEALKRGKAESARVMEYADVLSNVRADIPADLGSIGEPIQIYPAIDAENLSVNAPVQATEDYITDGGQPRQRGEIAPNNDREEIPGQLSMIPDTIPEHEGSTRAHDLEKIADQLRQGIIPDEFKQYFKSIQEKRTVKVQFVLTPSLHRRLLEYTEREHLTSTNEAGNRLLDMALKSIEDTTK